MSDTQKIRSSETPARMINDVLDLSKVEAGKMKLFLRLRRAETSWRTVVATRPPPRREERNRLECTARRTSADPGRRHEGAAGAADSALQRREVHGEGAFARRGARDRRHGELGRLPGPGHRDRNDPRADREALPGVHPGGRQHHAQVRRDRAGPRSLSKVLRHDGRRHQRGKRSWERVDLHRPAARRHRELRR